MSSSAASVTLKRRSEKLSPKRKLERLKRNVLLPQRLRRRGASFFSVSLDAAVSDGSRVAVVFVVVDILVGFAGSVMLCFFPLAIGSIQASCWSHYTKADLDNPAKVLKVL